MTEADITKEVMRGRLVVVGELRGTHAESAGYVDRRTGEAIKYVRVIYLIECACRGMLDRAVVSQKWTGVEDPELVNLPYEKGKLYAFFLDSFRLERGVFTGWRGDRGPEPFKTAEEAAVVPEGATAALKLVSLETTPQHL